VDQKKLSIQKNKADMVPNPAGPQQKKTVAQQDRVEALHDNRNTLEKKVHLSVIARERRDPPTKVT